MAQQIRNSRTFTVSFPLELAEQVEQLATMEHRTTSELFREAFRRYRSQRALSSLDSLVEDARKLGSNGHVSDDVDRLVDEVRSERLIAK